MAHEFISPNLHAILIHYPLGILIAGTMIELFSFLWRRSSFRLAGRWMILLGAMSAVPATFSGIYALNSVAQAHNPAGDAPWVDVKAASPTLSQPVIWHMMHQHLLYQSLATAICVLVVMFWLGCSDRARQSMHWLLMLMLLAGVGTIISGAYFGGESVYRHAVGVETNVTGATAVTAPNKDEPRFAWEQSFPPEEMHVIMAGIAIAIALVSIGLSFRKITASYEVTDDTRPIRPNERTMAETGPRTPASSVAMVRSFNPDIEVTVNPFAPASRFWLLTCLLALLTAAGGLYVLASDSDAFEQAKHSRQNLAKVLWNEVKPVGGEKVNRRLAHVVAGSAIIVLPIILAGLGRFAPTRRLWLSLFVLMLVAAVGSQVWFGALLLFDTPDGSIKAFNPSNAATTQPVPASAG